MAANTNPIFTLVPNVGSGKALTANAALDGTGTVVTVFTAGANGSIVDSISLTHLGTNVVTVLRLFTKVGAVYSLFFEETVAANTISQVAKSVAYEYIFDGVNRKRITLPASATIVASVGTTIAAGIQVATLGGDF
jgi:hypothetical protein